eukprot:gene24730-biopygen20914
MDNEYTAIRCCPMTMNLRTSSNPLQDAEDILDHRGDVTTVGHGHGGARTRSRTRCGTDTVGRGHGGTRTRWDADTVGQGTASKVGKQTFVVPAMISACTPSFPDFGCRPRVAGSPPPPLWATHSCWWRSRTRAARAWWMVPALPFPSPGAVHWQTVGDRECVGESGAGGRWKCVSLRSKMAGQNLSLGLPHPPENCSLRQPVKTNTG